MKTYNHTYVCTHGENQQRLKMGPRFCHGLEVVGLSGWPTVQSKKGARLFNMIFDSTTSYYVSVSTIMAPCVSIQESKWRHTALSYWEKWLCNPCRITEK